MELERENLSGSFIHFISLSSSGSVIFCLSLGRSSITLPDCAGGRHIKLETGFQRLETPRDCQGGWD